MHLLNWLHSTRNCHEPPAIVYKRTIACSTTIARHAWYIAHASMDAYPITRYSKHAQHHINTAQSVKIVS